MSRLTARPAKRKKFNQQVVQQLREAKRLGVCWKLVGSPVYGPLCLARFFLKKALDQQNNSVGSYCLCFHQSSSPYDKRSIGLLPTRLIQTRFADPLCGFRSGELRSCSGVRSCWEQHLWFLWVCKKNWIICSENLFNKTMAKFYGCYPETYFISERATKSAKSAELTEPAGIWPLIIIFSLYFIDSTYAIKILKNSKVL